MVLPRHAKPVHGSLPTSNSSDAAIITHVLTSPLEELELSPVAQYLEMGIIQ